MKIVIYKYNNIVFDKLFITVIFFTHQVGFPTQDNDSFVGVLEKTAGKEMKRRSFIVSIKTLRALRSGVSEKRKIVNFKHFPSMFN